MKEISPEVSLHLLKPYEEQVVSLPVPPGLLHVREVRVVHQLL